MRTILLVIALTALLMGAVIAVVTAWRAANISIEPIGWWAIGIGGGLSLLVGGGLMALVFFSARYGFDDRAAHPEDPDQ